MFPLSKSSVLQVVSSAAEFELQHSVPVQSVQVMTQEIPDFLQDHRLVAQGSFAVTLH